MSAESGVPTFREAATGLWSRFDVQTLATPEAWAEDPELVWAWYLWRAALVRSVEPNAGHRALAEWGRHRHLQVVTQNVDGLHERAGSPVLTHLHGSLLDYRCADCGTPAGGIPDLPAEPVERATPPPCVVCGGSVRPGVVWFSEMLPDGAIDLAMAAVTDTELVVVVGTSGLVHPAATLPDLARGRDVPVVEINPEETALSERVDHVWRSTAATALPMLVAELHLLP